MKRFAMCLVLAMLGASVGGCGSTFVEPGGGPMTRVALFDASPGWPSGQHMQYKSTWPSTVKYGAVSQQIFFTERFTDIQHSGNFGRRSLDTVIRRTDTIRTSRSLR